MKKWFWGLVILFVIGLAIGSAVIQDMPQSDSEELLEETDQMLGEDLQPDGTPIQITKDHVYKGNLLLINEDHPVPPEAKVSDAVNLSKHSELVNGYSILDNSIRLTPFLAHKLSEMIAAAHKDGINHFALTSGYRDEEEQENMYEEKEPGYALPAGFSEHNLGLAVDIGSTRGMMEHTAEGKWLRENAWKYGFILRYPEDKTEITGIPYEPWHYRYVGLPHSAIMYEHNFVLEEYLDYLKEQKSITYTVNRKKYTIYYHVIAEDTTIQVPADRRYDISGNNMDGVIVTVYSEQDDAPTNDVSSDANSTNQTPTGDTPATESLNINTPCNEPPVGKTQTDTAPLVEKPAEAVSADETAEIFVANPEETNG